jgi:hypothetical protein
VLDAQYGGTKSAEEAQLRGFRGERAVEAAKVHGRKGKTAVEVAVGEVGEVAMEVVVAQETKGEPTEEGHLGGGDHDDGRGDGHDDGHVRVHGDVHVCVGACDLHQGRTSLPSGCLGHPAE